MIGAEVMSTRTDAHEPVKMDCLAARRRCCRHARGRAVEGLARTDGIDLAGQITAQLRSPAPYRSVPVPRQPAQFFRQRSVQADFIGGKVHVVLIGITADQQRYWGTIRDWGDRGIKMAPELAIPQRN